MTTFHFPESLPAGAVVENLYRIDAVLGEGGMADVYAGRKLDLDVPVAVKVLKPIVDPERRARFQERFLKEAQLAARMDHPNVVRILGFHGAMTLRLPMTTAIRRSRPWTPPMRRSARFAVSVATSASG